MTTYEIHVKNKKSAIPFPKNAQIGDIAHVYFPPSNGTQLIHRYTLTLKGWKYYDFSVLYDK